MKRRLLLTLVLHLYERRISMFFFGNVIIPRDKLACKATIPSCAIIPEPRPERSINQRDSLKIKVLRRTPD